MWEKRISSTALTSVFLLLSSLSDVSASQFSISLKHKTKNCDQYENFNTSNGLYEIQTNAWGYDDSGSQCVTVGDNSDKTSILSAFASSWGWSSSGSSVKAYPNIKYLSESNNSLPVQLQNITSLLLNTTWSYEGGAESAATGVSNFSALADLNTRTNVAVDMFLGSDADDSTTTTTSTYEVMVWLGNFGSVVPLGYSNGSQAVQTLDGSSFDLYVGNNTDGQTVFSWLAQANLTTFEADLLPLVLATADYGGPDTTDYLGVFQFGTETFHTDDADMVTFTANSVSLQVATNIVADSTSSGSSSSGSSGSSGSSSSSSSGKSSDAMTYGPRNALSLALFVSGLAYLGF